MNLPLVSIVIPCYNAEPFIGESIESALAQTYGNVEVIVIDDGSTDDSLKMIRSFHNRIAYETGPNRGGSAARNRGLALARGEFVQFLDADDYLHPTKLERQLAMANEDCHSIVYCDYETRDEYGELVVGNQSPACVPADPVCFVLAHYGLQTSAPLHPRGALQRVGGFREGLPCCQERDLHLRLACSGYRFRHLKESLYTVRRVKDSVSGDFIRVLDQHSEIAWNAGNILLENGELTDERSAALAGFLARDARAYLQRGEPSKAREYFRQARRLHCSGGIKAAYSRSTRWLRRILGASVTEYLVARKRTVFAN